MKNTSNGNSLSHKQLYIDVQLSDGRVHVIEVINIICDFFLQKSEVKMNYLSFLLIYQL